ncbi:nucleoside phosphorylase domain-containing protein [Lasiosphaeria miniovina]|uniref:Nucleoside phosphorylase domain-containing protein n=1 Tax=Lasiosphaeria miniovina TaxID=1954250 RepID=A0AA40BG02_9PEZI|nr:nucleoside phosphorylase domain-containing protein [Lasiosphaeria miniovina]KAK0733540.1 nucleoside phosphorylase domain-containing protein [Lasiosphaeria miniovina]
MATRPASRAEFRIAIVCALQREYNAVSLLVDEFWDKKGDPYGRASGDPYTYRTGRIGDISIVLVLLSDMGKASAASAAASVRSSYPNLELILLTGICGGVPRTDANEEILLGDVVLAGLVVQYDFGKQYPDGFQTNDTVKGNLSKPSKKVRNLLSVLETDPRREDLQRRVAAILQELQHASHPSQLAKHQFPGAGLDKLYQSSYRHKHRVPADCSKCMDPHNTGEPSRTQTCGELGCDDAFLMPRNRKHNLESPAPYIFFGCIGSGDTVVKSGEDRDRIAKEHRLIAFEMEGAGVWDEIPCIIIRGVCDYADSHKNKRWQDYAAATAASTMKTLLELYPKADENRDQLLQLIPPNTNKDNCQRTVIEGLGGVGKTQVALEAAYRVHHHHADCSIFWVSAVDIMSFENAYRNIGQKLGISGVDDDDVDVKSLIKTALENSSNSWLLVIDNADDIELVFGGRNSPGSAIHLPFSRNGSIILTTRNHKVAVRFNQRNIIALAQMNQTEATGIGIYMAEMGMSAAKYLHHCYSSNKTLIQLLSRDFDDQGRILHGITRLPHGIYDSSAFSPKKISPYHYYH